MVDFEMETFEERVAGQELDNFVDIRHVLLDVFFNQFGEEPGPIQERMGGRRVPVTTIVSRSVSGLFGRWSVEVIWETRSPVVLVWAEIGGRRLMGDRRGDFTRDGILDGVDIRTT